MGITKRQFACLAILLAPLVCASSAAAVGDESEELLREVQGKWARQQSTPGGLVRVVKEHKGQRTVVTAYDDKENVLYSHESEFKVERSGQVRIFTFSKRLITAGPNAGSKIAAPQAFVYRVSDDRFIEAHGLLENETSTPTMIVWERVKDTAPGK